MNKKYKQNVIEKMNAITHDVDKNYEDVDAILIAIGKDDDLSLFLEGDGFSIATIISSIITSVDENTASVIMTNILMEKPELITEAAEAYKEI